MRFPCQAPDSTLQSHFALQTSGASSVKLPGRPERGPGLSLGAGAADNARSMPLPEPAREHDRRAGSRSVRAMQTEVAVRTIVDRLPAILYVADVGVGGRWHYISSGATEILGFTPEEWMADEGLWARQVHPEDRERVFGRENDLLEPDVPEEYRILHRDGRVLWVRDEAALVTDAEGRGRWHGVMLDITDRKLAEAELERRAEQQAAVARLGEHALEGAEVATLMHDALEEAVRILGVELGGVLETTTHRSTPILRASLGLEQDARELPADVGAQLVGQIEGRGGHWGELWLATSQQRTFGAADVDFVQALANILADAIQQRGAEDDIRYQALHDPLTGLPNRVLFMDRLGHALSRPGAEVAVVLLDIDNFKLVNDSLGHSAGDELLMEIAPRLQDALRPSDTIARLGGDEFVVLLEQVPHAHAAARVAERIVAAFEAPFQLAAGEHFAKASLGIAIADESDSVPASLIRDADAAMYQAKGGGRGSFELFDRAMRIRTVERLSLENDLRRALERGELRLDYQPIVSLKDGSIASVETLLRWQHPERGLIGPDEFIGVAEECGLIEPIGRWVLETASVQAAEWHAADPDTRPLGISVNLSVRQLTQRDLETTVARALHRSGIEPSSLCLEITESILLEEPDSLSDTITRVSRLGVRFALDDFGTGYSSLAYLTRLPIHGLKVDRSFVDALGRDERATAITTAIVRMAHALSLEVTAEGVETEAQVRALDALRCELAQGFHFHRPLSAAAVSKLLAEQRPPRDDEATRDDEAAGEGGQLIARLDSAAMASSDDEPFGRKHVRVYRRR
jgi:diguanylate cyclase (GGDEF)-like protein/PAS domain S-box-containing protein